MDVLKVYKRNKRAYRKDKQFVMLATMQEIDLCISCANIDDNFLKEYKLYKYMLLLTNTIIPSMIFGLGTGTITTVMGFFLSNISDTILLTFSNLMFVSIGFIGIIVIYILSCRGELVYILLPYTVQRLEEKIKDFNLYCLSEQIASEHIDSDQECKVKVKRIQKKRNNKGR